MSTGSKTKGRKEPGPTNPYKPLEVAHAQVTEELGAVKALLAVRDDELKGARAELRDVTIELRTNKEMVALHYKSWQSQIDSHTSAVQELRGRQAAHDGALQAHDETLQGLQGQLAECQEQRASQERILADVVNAVNAIMGAQAEHSVAHHAPADSAPDHDPVSTAEAAVDRRASIVDFLNMKQPHVDKDLAAGYADVVEVMLASTRHLPTVQQRLSVELLAAGLSAPLIEARPSARRVTMYAAPSPAPSSAMVNHSDLLIITPTPPELTSMVIGSTASPTTTAPVAPATMPPASPSVLSSPAVARIVTPIVDDHVAAGAPQSNLPREPRVSSANITKRRASQVNGRGGMTGAPKKTPREATILERSFEVDSTATNSERPQREAAAGGESVEPMAAAQSTLATDAVANSNPAEPTIFVDDHISAVEPPRTPPRTPPRDYSTTAAIITAATTTPFAADVPDSLLGTSGMSVTPISPMLESISTPGPSTPTRDAQVQRLSALETGSPALASSTPRVATTTAAVAATESVEPVESTTKITTVHMAPDIPINSNIAVTTNDRATAVAAAAEAVETEAEPAASTEIAVGPVMLDVPASPPRVSTAIISTGSATATTATMEDNNPADNIPADVAVIEPAVESATDSADTTVVTPATEAGRPIETADHNINSATTDINNDIINNDHTLAATEHDTNALDTSYHFDAQALDYIPDSPVASTDAAPTVAASPSPVNRTFTRNLEPLAAFLSAALEVAAAAAPEEVPAPVESAAPAAVESDAAPAAPAPASEAAPDPLGQLWSTVAAEHVSSTITTTTNTALAAAVTAAEASASAPPRMATEQAEETDLTTSSTDVGAAHE